ncbi:NodT family efflux transporter outer membrane factor (OMF) lipoprotein [Pseudomonas duriflava]|uniref:NodT family efflux transporter outer membrane factor (OMF) lipoprotein n=1 Tax=Pseudomonas duriflava TaxID=459528 RepID=A0A562QJ44_9PSED|nr:efflux transporter outer membrane subunit [Pseudomonas duriflava]TWI56759.1 NodT family efflux transporter outer membrane factor (OMF) lipoprotein [Pseudomonas duriflava]
MSFLCKSALLGFGFFVLTSTISGCISTHGIAPQTQPTEANTLSTDEAIRAATREAHWPASEWWRAYQDPQLNQWIADSLTGNPSLASAAARVRSAKAMAGLAESAEAPHLNADIALRRYAWPTDSFYGPGELADQTTWNNNASLGFSYNLDFWGRERDASERALDQAHQAAAEERVAVLELTSNIVRTYIQLSLQYAQHDIAQATLEQQEQIAQLARRQLEGGIGTQFEVSQAEALLPETHRQIEALDEEIALLRNQLAALAGRGPGDAARLVRPRLQLGATPTLPSKLPLELVGHRPDIVASRWRIAAEAKGVDVARADFYPNIDLAATLGQSMTMGTFKELFTAAKTGYSFGPAISLPIFDGGERRAHLGIASARYDAAIAHYDQTLVSALKDISDHLIRLDSANKQATLAHESVEAAQRTYTIARQAFERGLTDYLHVLDAQTRLFAQQRVEQQVQALRLSAQAGLIASLGGGVITPEDGPEEKELKPVRVEIAGKKNS